MLARLILDSRALWGVFRISRWVSGGYDVRGGPSGGQRSERPIKADGGGGRLLRAAGNRSVRVPAAEAGNSFSSLMHDRRGESRPGGWWFCRAASRGLHSVPVVDAVERRRTPSEEHRTRIGLIDSTPCLNWIIQSRYSRFRPVV